MYVVVVYDITSEGDEERKEKNRRRLYKKLKDFETPVQYSVFEFNLTPSQKRRLMEVLSKYIEEDDRVSVYTLCEECRKNIERLWTTPRFKPITDDTSSVEV